MKINITSKKGIVLLALFVMMSCGGAKSSDNGLNTEEKKEVKTSTSQGETATKKESKSYEEELKERMDPIEAKLNKIIESGENMLSASFELDEKWKAEYEKVYNLVLSKVSGSEKSNFETEEKEWFEKEEKKIKKELLDDGLSEGDRDYEMLFASHRAGLVKKRAMELAQKYDELSK
jgi:lipoprotein